MLAGALMTGTASADDRTFTYECDTDAGHYSSWSMTTQAPALVITGTLRLNDMIAGQDWFVKNLQDALKVIPKEKIICAVANYGYDWAMKKGQKPVKFRLELTATGTLRANVGGAEKATELGAFTPKKIELGCSTGDFSFADVRIEEIQR